MEKGDSCGKNEKAKAYLCDRRVPPSAAGEAPHSGLSMSGHRRPAAGRRSVASWIFRRGGAGGGGSYRGYRWIQWRGEERLALGREGRRGGEEKGCWLGFRGPGERLGAGQRGKNKTNPPHAILNSPTPDRAL
jgi:hypothetical protein